MRKWLRNKIEQWRNRSEGERMKIAMRLTWATGAGALVLWLAILLPLQLRFNAMNEEPEGTVQGVVSQEQPTASPTPTPLSIFE